LTTGRGQLLECALLGGDLDRAHIRVLNGNGNQLKKPAKLVNSANTIVQTELAQRAELSYGNDTIFVDIRRQPRQI
jgi:hypothetical protein